MHSTIHITFATETFHKVKFISYVHILYVCIVYHLPYIIWVHCGPLVIYYMGAL